MHSTLMRSGRTTIIADSVLMEFAANLGPVLCVPLEVGGRTVGAISLARTRGAPNYTEEDVSVAESFVAVEYGRNLAEREKAERRMAARMEVTQAIIEGRDASEVLKLVAARARDLVGAALGPITSPEPGGDELIVRVADGAQADALLGARILAAGSLSGQVFGTRRSVTVPRRVDRCSARPLLCPAAVAQMGKLGPALFVPLYVANRSIGAMMVANQKGSAAFTAEDLSLVESFAAQAAMSFEIATVRERLQRLTSVTIASQKPLGDALAALARAVVDATDTIACGIFLIDAERRLTTAGTC